MGLGLSSCRPLASDRALFLIGGGQDDLSWILGLRRGPPTLARGLATAALAPEIGQEDRGGSGDDRRNEQKHEATKDTSTSTSLPRAKRITCPR